MPAVNNTTTFICYIAGIPFTKFDGVDRIDETRCDFANIAMVLNNIHLGHICAGLLILIILISIFGRIKENYRWFILNQVFWDLFMTYDYIDDNSIFKIILGSTKEKRGFYRFIPANFQASFFSIMQTQPYSSLLLLCITRFLCLYFMNFYEKLTRKRRILYFIIIFNFITLIFHTNDQFFNLADDRQNYLSDLCNIQAKTKKQKNLCFYDFEYVQKKYYSPDFLYNFWDIIYKTFSIIVYLKPMIFLLFSIIATSLIIFKIAKQAKFQIKHNKRDFFNSLRVSLVMLLQTILYFLVFCPEFFKFIQGLWFVNIFISYPQKDYDMVGYEIEDCPENSFICLYFPVPKWLHSEFFGLADARILQTIVQIRIFLESIIVLSIMTGYREAIFKLIKFIYKFVNSPIKKYLNIKSIGSSISTSDVKAISRTKK